MLEIVKEQYRVLKGLQESVHALNISWVHHGSTLFPEYCL